MNGRSQFPLFQSHLDLAHKYWSETIRPGDTVVDATCGNGHDTLQLARLVGAEGKVYAYDIQPQAIATTRTLLQNEGMLDRVQLCQMSHEDLSVIPSPRAVIYNLGYLPRSDKSITTQAETTLLSITQALKKLQNGGILSITAYPGHPEGLLEKNALQQRLMTLAPQEWSCTFHQWLNRQAAPCLFLIQRQTFVPEPGMASFEGKNLPY